MVKRRVLSGDLEKEAYHKREGNKHVKLSAKKHAEKPADAQEHRRQTMLDLFRNDGMHVFPVHIHTYMHAYLHTCLYAFRR